MTKFLSLFIFLIFAAVNCLIFKPQFKEDLVFFPSFSDYPSFLFSNSLILPQVQISHQIFKFFFARHLFYHFCYYIDDLPRSNFDFDFVGSLNLVDNFLKSVQSELVDFQMIFLNLYQYIYEWHFFQNPYKLAIPMVSWQEI